MRTGTVAFLAGILLLIQFSELPSTSWLTLFPLVLLLMFYPSRLRLPAWFVCGFLWALLRAGLVLSDGLDPALEGKTVTLTGQVVSLVEVRNPGVRFEFQIDEMRIGHQIQSSNPGKVLLSWYRDAADLKPGESWQLAVRLKRPHGFMNPGGFDYEGWLFKQRLRATGYVVAMPDNRRLQDASIWSVNGFRQTLRNRIDTALDDHPFRGLVTGLSLGDRSAINSEQRQVLINTGTSHLLAISGLHIGLIAGLVFLLVRRLWGRLGPLALWLSAPRAAALIAILVALVYAMLAGFAVPTQRALIMLTVVMWSLITYQRFAFSHVIATALLLVLLLDPLAVMAPGFWLSFAAIAVIAYGMLYRQDTKSFWWRWGRAQYLVAIGLLPLLLLWFQQVPLYGIGANLLAIPWVSLLVVPLSLLGTLGSLLQADVSFWLLTLAAELLQLFWPFLEWLAGLSQSTWQAPAPAMPVLLLALVGIAILLLPRGMPGRWLGFIWLLPLLLQQPSRPAAGELWLTLLDVGQGLSIVVQTQNHSLVYDAGARFSSRFNAGDAVVVPFLHQIGITQLDRLVISHGDNDHIGGAAAVLSAFSSTEVLTSAESRKLPGAGLCQRGQVWQWDAVQFEVLHPGDKLHNNRNNRSCVIKIEIGKQAVLLTGDIEKEAEHELLKYYGEMLASTVLVVPHHGSKTSSTKKFVTAVAPELALIPVGYRNRFRLPNQDILERYASLDIDMYNTAQHGAITIKIGSDGLSLSTYRQEAGRFWHNSP